MKERIDELLVRGGFFETKDKAQRAIMAGIVIVNDQKVLKAGDKFSEESIIRIKGETLRYVSRGGLKLEKAIKEFSLKTQGSVVIDVGASTGGFTDCALQHGAEFVYSIDVGTNQLDWKLRTDARVKSIENKHIKDLEPEEVDNRKADIIVIDVSFISLTSILQSIKRFLKNDGKIVALIKPQFEIAKEKIEKGGIVKNAEHHKEAIDRVLSKTEELSLICEGITCSPIKGTYGNVEYLALFSMDGEKKEINIEEIVVS